MKIKNAQKIKKKIKEIPMQEIVAKLAEPDRPSRSEARSKASLTQWRFRQRPCEEAAG